jgi:vacuolar-type H+-ATPase subunit H
MGSDGPARRREIEDTTAARLAEIVAAAERAAKQVIDEAEEEARTRIADANEEAERIVAARLAGLGDLTDEINAQAEALVRQAEALQGALARARAEMGATEGLGGSATMGRRNSDPAARKPAGPTLSVVGGVPEEPTPEDRLPPGDRLPPDGGDGAAPARDRFGREIAAENAARAPEASASAPSQDFADEISLDNGNPAGARLLATQMAVSGSSRAEIEARLRHGFEIADTRAILDAILGPEN